jgi:polyhydroxybutyrate depolymerase
MFAPRRHVGLGLIVVALCGLASCGSSTSSSASDSPTAPGGRLSVDGGTPTFTLASGSFTISHDGRRRHYIVHVPPRLASPNPLAIMVLHGGGGAADQMAPYTGMDALADQHGFVAVYPEGVAETLIPGNHHWNAGNCDGVIGKNCGGPTFRAGVDDVGFFARLLDELRAQGVGKVFVSGISNGGMMAHRVGCALADRVSGIASVAGALALPSVEPAGTVRCVPARALEVLIIHARNDMHLPYEGGQTSCSARDRLYPSVEYAVSFWRNANGCTEGPIPVHSRGNANCVAYSGCQCGVEVRLCSIDEPLGSKIGGHSWPGAPLARPRCDDPNIECPCKASPDLDASAAILERASR